MRLLPLRKHLIELSFDHDNKAFFFDAYNYAKNARFVYYAFFAEKNYHTLHILRPFLA